MATTALIGRDRSVDTLRTELDRAVASHGGLVLVTGEAGIGKTTLVTDAAGHARRSGALVLSGSCWHAASAPGYWPWVQVIRALRRGAAEPDWHAAERAAGGNLAPLLGEASSDADPVDAFEIYDAVTSALVSVCHNRPVVVVLEDLHWADAASLKLLEFAAQHTWFERLLLLGTYRDAEVESPDHPLRPLLSPLRSKATTVALTGLDRDQVGTLVARTVGTEPDADLVAEVHRRTGGNPFFVEQTARLWHSGGSITAIAPEIRDTVLRRLALLPAPVGELLATAAVIGREFHRRLLSAVAGEPVPQVDRRLDQAVTARLVTALGGGRFAFAHDLVRETLVDRFDDAEARRRHAAVVHAVDRTPTLADQVTAAELANHGHLAGDELDAGRRLDLFQAAAVEAQRRLAMEESVAHRRRAFRLAADTDPARQVLIGVDLAHELDHTQDSAQARDIVVEIADVARRLDDHGLFARVALSVHSVHSISLGHEQFRIDLLREAYRNLTGDDAPFDDITAGDPAAVNRIIRELTTRIEAVARGAGDDEALGFVLWTRHDALWGPGTARQRQALTEEMLEISRRTGDRDGEYYATSLRWVALLEQGDPEYADQLRRFVALVERFDSRMFELGSLVDQGIIATMQGRFADAATLFDRMRDLVEPHEHEHFGFFDVHLRWALLQVQGRFDELDELHDSVTREQYPHPELIAGITAAQRGDADATARLHAEATANRARYPQNMEALWLRFAAQAAALSRDPDSCRQARAGLAPYRDQWAVAMYGCDIGGPMVLWSAVVDAAQERWDDAIAGFTAAYRSADRLRARPWSVEARFRLAQALRGRDTGDDRAVSGRLLSEVAREAAEIGMRHIVARASRERSTSDRPPAAAPGPQFRSDGAVWTLTYDGDTVHVPDAKGLRDLHYLLAHPGTEVPAVRLLDPAGGEIVVAAGRMGGDPVLDDEAKARYRRRLAQLDAEIDRAADRGDTERLAGYDRERQALLSELRTAAGLGGRTRRLGDAAERARKAVTARIRDVLRKLDQRHPALAEHLRAAVTTGATCRYRPDRDVAWRL